jgi:uncharacterized protein DUF1524
MTIEHIAAENPKPSAVTLKHVGRLGNLLLLPEKVNGELGNADLATKLKAYKKCGVPLDPVLENATAWTDGEIEARTNELARRAYETVFKVQLDQQRQGESEKLGREDAGAAGEGATPPARSGLELAASYLELDSSGEDPGDRAI